MNIGIDGSTLGGNRAGVGRYVFELCRALDRQLPHAEFFVYSHVPVEMPVDSPRWHSRVETTTWAPKLKNILWLKTRAPALCRGDDLDAFWACGTFLPRLPSKVRSVVTVYDMNSWLAKDTMKWTAYVAHKLFIERDIKRADTVVSISQGTAKRLQEIVGRQSNGVVLPAVSESFRRPSADVVSATLTRLGIDGPYFLAVGTLEPRKNLAMLIEAFTALKRAGQLPAHQLVLVGGKGWRDVGLRSLVEACEGLGVNPLGFVDDADLPSLFAGSEAFVFPSIYEGFGMPVLEARACAARVIASDIPEIREAGGSGPIYIAPLAGPLREALLQVCADSALGATNANSLPSWDVSAAALAEILCAGPVSKK